jgi:sigma-B regulation protein RsbU (phosphoserine phosphatase)
MHPLEPALKPAPHVTRDGHPHDYPRALETACQVKQHLFPRKLPRPPGWDCAACCRPAQPVGGDYHDLFEAGPGRLAVAVADVAGKGLGPALVTAHLHALVRSLLPPQPEALGRFAAGLNDHLAAFLPPDFFVTLFLAVLDLADGRLCYVNAGHPPALLVDPGCPGPADLSAGGTPLGAFAGERYSVGQARLRPGSLLAVFSDGLTDVHDAAGRMFRVSGVAGALLGLRHQSAAGVRDGLCMAAAGWRGDAVPEDDLTVVVVRRTPVTSSAGGAATK